MTALAELPRDRFPRTWEALEAGVKEGVAPGFVAGLWTAVEPDQFRAAAIGHRRIEPSPQPMLTETVFDIASVSKVFATATLAAVLVERGWIRWQSPVRSIFPSYPSGDITLAHLLSHTAGLIWWEPFYERIRDRFAPLPLNEVSIADRQMAMRELVLNIRPQAAPGERVEYSDVGAMLAGFMLEEAAQRRLDQAVKEFVWDRMGLQPYYYSTTQSPSVANETVAATELSPWHGVILQGQVHDENCWAMGGYSAHSGVFARVEDLLRFSRELMNGFLSASVSEPMWTRVVSPTGCERTLGWDTPGETGSSVGRFFSRKTVGHLGFTGCSLWIDREVRLAVALMSNRVHPTRENIKIRAFRPRFHDAIRADLA